MCTVTCSVDVLVDVGTACVAWSEFHVVGSGARTSMPRDRAAGDAESRTTSCERPGAPWSRLPAVGGTHPTRSVSFHLVDSTTTRVTADIDFSCDPAQGELVSHAALADLRHFKRFVEHRSRGRLAPA